MSKERIDELIRKYTEGENLTADEIELVGLVFPEAKAKTITKVPVKEKPFVKTLKHKNQDNKRAGIIDVFIVALVTAIMSVSSLIILFSRI